MGGPETSATREAVSGEPSAAARPRVLVTWPVAESALARLRERCEVAVLAAAEAREPGRLRVALAGADALLCLVTERVDETLLAHAPRLRVVANMAVGYDNVDVGAATARGIAVTNTPGVLDDATADLAIALMLAVARRVVEGDRMVRAGGFCGWSPDLLVGTDVAGKTLGIVGLGRIGTATARRAALGFGMRVLYCARSAKPGAERELGARRASLEDLLGASDFVSIHVPLTEDSRHLLDRAALARMPPRAILVNTSRGAVIDEEALVEALRAGRLAGAGLDVYEHEPRLAAGLAELPNVVLLPHVGSATRETRERMAHRAVDNVLAVLDGRPPRDPVPVASRCCVGS
jgi:glyoxylate reductase